MQKSFMPAHTRLSFGPRRGFSTNAIHSNNHTWRTWAKEAKAVLMSGAFCLTSAVAKRMVRAAASEQITTKRKLSGLAMPRLDGGGHFRLNGAH